MELWGEAAGLWAYFEGRVKRNCRWIRCGEREGERQRERGVWMTLKDFGLKKLRDWICYPLIQMERTGDEKVLGDLFGAQFWNM